jgi:hypothetical protein
MSYRKGDSPLKKHPGAEPWTLEGAALVDSTGEEVELARRSPTG